MEYASFVVLLEMCILWLLGMAFVLVACLWLMTADEVIEELVRKHGNAF